MRKGADNSPNSSYTSAIPGKRSGWFPPSRGPGGTRKNRVFQDLLVIDTLNGKFAVEPGSQADFHQPIPEGLDLRNVFCTEETRVISNDWVIRYKNRFFQLVSQSNLTPAKNKVIVQEHLDGSIHLRYRGMEVKFKEISRLQARPQPLKLPFPTLGRDMFLLRIIPGEDSIPCTWEERRRC